MNEYAAAYEEHGRGAGDRESLHQSRRHAEHGGACAALRPREPRFATLPAEIQPGVVELDDAGDQSVDACRHDESNADEHRQLVEKWLGRQVSQHDNDDLGRYNEIGSHRALDPVFFECYQVYGGIRDGARTLDVTGSVLSLAVQELVCQLFEAFITQECAA